ncbi:MAG: tetratricopeptide repeat protein, partial [Planctomycetes bacterium]|nr:tetratricopeptide repeat protein [Planctomycetota bacterium]
PRHKRSVRMSYLLEIMGRGLLAELSAAFRDLLYDDQDCATAELIAHADQEPEDAVHHQRLGIRMLANHQLSRARPAFSKALQLDSADHVSRIGLACTLDELGLTRSAMEQLHIAVERSSDHSAAWFALGFCEEKLEETDEAVDSYESAIRLTPQLRNAHERLAAIHLKHDRLDEAIAQYEHLCAGEPDDVTAALALANLYIRAGRFQEAIERYQFALTIDPENWEAQDEFVTACVEAGKTGDAIEVLRRLIDRQPECAGHQLRLGDLYRTAGRSGEALDAYRRAVELSPDYLEAVIKVGMAHMRSGKFQEAIEAFGRAIELNDRLLSAYIGLGVAQQEIGQTDEALVSFEAAARIEPNSTLLFSETARLQLQMSVALQMRQYLAPHVLADSPGHPPAHEITAMIDRQVDNLRAAVREHPGHADLHYQLGLLLRHRGDLTGAIGAYRNVVAINPDYLKALTKLGLALREAGDMDASAEVFKQALHVDRHSIALHYQLGLIFADRNEFALALRQFEYAAEQAPEKIDHVANLALCLQDMGLVDRANAAWQSLADNLRDTPDGRSLEQRLVLRRT